MATFKRSALLQQKSAISNWRFMLRRHPMKIPEPRRMVGRVMLTEAPQLRTTGLTKPTPDTREIPYAGRVREIVGQRPNLSQ